MSQPFESYCESRFAPFFCQPPSQDDRYTFPAKTFRMGYLENGGCKSHAAFAGSSLAFIASILHEFDAANFSRACRHVPYPMVLPSLEIGPSSPTMIVRDVFLDAGAATPTAGMCFNLNPCDVPALVLLC
jgi:hypothetical protein